MNEVIQWAIELAREGRTQEAYEIIDQELRLDPDNALAWAIRAQLADNEEDRLESLRRASRLATSERELDWIRHALEPAEEVDLTETPHAFDMAFLDDDTDHSMQTQVLGVEKEKPRRRGCLPILIATMLLVIIVLFASVFLVPELQQMIPFLNQPGPVAVMEEPTAAAEPNQTPLPPTPMVTPAAEVSPTPVGIPVMPEPGPVLTRLVLPEGYGLEDDFGRSIAINSNQVVVVGAPRSDLGDSDADSRSKRGAVYIYRFNDSSNLWELRQVLTPPETVEGFHFGLSVAIDDQDAIAVGWGSGAVSIYQAGSDGWALQQTIGGEADKFGFGTSVAIDGNMLAVGWPNYRGEDGDILYAGAVHIYKLTVSWKQQTVLTLEEPEEYDQFGASVALDSNTLAVGMLGRDNPDSGEGGVHVYQLDGSDWVRRAVFTEPEDTVFSVFGYAVDIKDSLIAVGTYFDPAGELVQPGAAFIFEDLSDQQDWSEVLETRLDNPDPIPEATFGFDVATDGQFVAVSELAIKATGQGTIRGRAYRFKKLGDSTWRPDTLHARDIEQLYSFGSSIDIFGDMVAIGAPKTGAIGENLPETAFLFYIPSPYPEDTTPTAADLGLVAVAESWTIMSPVSEPDDRFGETLAISGQMIVAGQRFDPSGWDAHIFSLSGEDWERFDIAKPEEVENFGAVVAADGDTVIIGDPTNGNYDFRAYLRDGSSWIEQGQLVLPEDATINEAGMDYTAALSGDTAAIGGSRGIMIFTRSAGVWSVRARIDAPEQAGFAPQLLALDQDTLTVGLNNPDYPVVALVYQRTGDEWKLRATLDAGTYNREQIGASLDLSGRRVVIGTGFTPGDDFPPVIVYEDISPDGDWSQVTQNTVPRPLDGIYNPVGSTDPGRPNQIWTFVVIDGDQIVFAGVPVSSYYLRYLGSAYCSRLENGVWELTHQLSVPGTKNTGQSYYLDIDMDGELVAISLFDWTKKIGQILVYEIVGQN